MKNLTLILAALVAVSPAFAQDKTMGKPMMKKPMMKRSLKMDPTMGLTPAEKKVAMDHMAKMTAMEMGAHKHMMQQVSMGKSNKAAMMALSKSDQVTLDMMMKKMTPTEKKVAMKMMDHARMMHMGMKKPTMKRM